jgi:hypothetical protein
MSPKTLDESLEGLDESLQHLYDKMNWGKYKAYPTTGAFNMAIDITSTEESQPLTIYTSTETLNQLMQQNYVDQMKLTTEEFDLIKILVEDKLEEIYNGPEGIETYWNTEMMKTLLKKIDKYYDDV